MKKNNTAFLYYVDGHYCVRITKKKKLYIISEYKFLKTHIINVKREFYAN